MKLRWLRNVFVTSLILETSLSHSLADVGKSPTSMPGIHRVGVPVPVRSGELNAAASMGYGYTEAVLNDNDSHHRIGGSIAASVSPLPWLLAGLEVEGRYDTHSTQTEGKDEGWIGDPRIRLRGATALSPELLLGVESVVWLPGKDAPSLALDATSLDMVAMAAYSPGKETGLWFAPRLGFRLDGRDASIENSDELSASDRLALNLSSWNAVLLGLGVLWNRKQWEWMAEWTADVQVGSGAPAFGVSPMRLGAGVRYQLDKQSAWRVQAYTEVSLSSRPDLQSSLELIPVEPRWSAFLALAGSWDVFARKPKQDLRTPLRKQPASISQPVIQKTEELSASGRVLDVEGKPLAFANLTASNGVREVSTQTDIEGKFQFKGFENGLWLLRATAEGYEAAEKEFEVVSGMPTGVTLTLQPYIVRGQLRGMIQSFEGRPLAATIRVAPSGKEVFADTDGTFLMELEPGVYDVVVQADGYLSQERRIQIEANGVTLLNVDMRGSP